MGVTTRVSVMTRSLARRSGLLRWIVAARTRLRPRKRRSAYEERFSGALLAAVRVGDCVWDVGANVGHYTGLLSAAVGHHGIVCAFEPAPACFAVLRGAAAPNVRAFNLALGDREGEIGLSLAADPLGDTHSLSFGSPSGASTVPVFVRTGDTLIADGTLPAPTVIKIDVEGFELEVIEGLSGTLAARTCRAVFLEVHFGLLEARGKRFAPAQIESRLGELGFRTSWVDASHLAARREAVAG